MAASAHRLYITVLLLLSLAVLNDGVACVLGKTIFIIAENIYTITTVRFLVVNNRL